MAFAVIQRRSIFEEIAQPLAGVGTPEPVGAQNVVRTGHKAVDLVGVGAHIVGCRHHRSGHAFEALADIAAARRLVGMQPVPALGLYAVTRELGE